MLDPTNAMFAVRKRIEKHRGGGGWGPHMACIDLENAYDKVSPQEVWRRTKEKGRLCTKERETG